MEWKSGPEGLTQTLCHGETQKFGHGLNEHEYGEDDGSGCFFVWLSHGSPFLKQD